MKYKKSHEVIITTGKDKGKKAKIEKVSFSKQVVYLPGLNIFKRHLKKRDDKNPGGIIDFSRPVDISNIALICPKCGKQTRVGYKITKDGGKTRICKRCKAAV